MIPTKQIRINLDDYEYIRQIAFEKHIPMNEVVKELIDYKEGYQLTKKGEQLIEALKRYKDL